jgi:hypothetical protein
VPFARLDVTFVTIGDALSLVKPTRFVQIELLPTESTARANIVVVAFAATLPVKVMPGLAKAVLATDADLGVEHVPSKYRVTVDVSDTVPNNVGVNVAAGLDGLNEE